MNKVTRKYFQLQFDSQDSFEKNLLSTLESMDRTVGDLFWLRLAQSVIPRNASPAEMESIIKNVTKWALIPQTPDVFEKNRNFLKTQNLQNKSAKQAQNSAPKVPPVNHVNTDVDSTQNSEPTTFEQEEPSVNHITKKTQPTVKLRKYLDSLSEGLF